MHSSAIANDSTMTAAATTNNSSQSKQANKNKAYPIHVSADQLISQTKGGQSEYKGNVYLDRNQLNLRGQRLVILHPNDQLQQATMTGSPAKFKDYLEEKQQWVNGEAKRIVYEQSNDTITLIDEAMMVMDNGNKINADKIVIYNKTETFEAFGSQSHGRIKMIIQPED